MPLGNTRQYGRSKRLRAIIQNALLAAVVIATVSTGIMYLIKNRNDSLRGYSDLLQSWNNGAYAEVYTESGKMLEDAPLDFFLLSMHGYAAYYMALSMINTKDIEVYTDECVTTLRKTLLCKEGERNGRICYVLGKAYFLKGMEYANLSIKYLEDALKFSYHSEDIQEYLGLAYAEAHEYWKSIAAFSEALVPVGGDEDPSDTLLLAIARSYIEVNEDDGARAYLSRCLEVSKDFSVIAVARLLLGRILMKTGDIEGAERLYLSILQEGGEQADARYELGVLYAERGETIKARAEWRKALRLDPAYAPARARLSM
ncbi:MAG: tetratricopeptide repeat protein [Spirochaetaceae bacterium]|jgi:tetratricopeptide (TPR) repeat protein|nr:tetratricopeptide repeat protein [Spirochaetaceae bacterium]